MKVSLVPRALMLFDRNLVTGKRKIVITLWLINATRRYDLTSERQTLEEFS